MKGFSGRRAEASHLVTDARRSRAEDIAYRERRYLAMMGFRVICFVAAVVLFTQGAGWISAIPAAGAIVIPYIAVVFANGGREPDRGRRFRPYEPNLPTRFSPPAPGPAATPGPGSASTGGGPADTA